MLLKHLFTQAVSKVMATIFAITYLIKHFSKLLSPRDISRCYVGKKEVSVIK